MNTQKNAHSLTQNKLLKFNHLFDYLIIENDTYQMLLELEIDKTDSIINRDAKNLQKISEKQEQAMQTSIKIQLNNSILMQQLQSKHNNSLTSLLKSMQLDEKEKQRADKYIVKLKDTVSQLKDVSNKNNILLQNNVDFFHSIMSIFEEKETRYSIFDNNMGSKNMQKSLFLNTQA